MATRTIATAGGNWSALGTWDEGAVPTSADDVVARGDGTSGNLVIDVSSACRSIDFTNYSHTCSGTAALAIGTTTAGPSNTAITLAAAMGWPYTGTISYVGTSGVAQTITSNGKTFSAPVTVNSASNTLQFADAYNSSVNNATVILTNGTLDTNGQTCTFGVLTVTNNTNVRLLAIGASNITIAGTGSSTSLQTSGVLTNFSVTGTGTITFTGSSKTLQFGAVNWGGTSISIILNGTSITTLTGASTFYNLLAVGATRTVTLPASTTITVTHSLQLSAPGALTETINSSSSGTAATISAGGGVTVTLGGNLSIKDITVTGGATFQAINSTNVSGNTGITFITKNGTWT